jgi:hypothetical protein
LKHSHWLEIGALAGELWPNQNWPPETMASAYEMFASIELEPTQRAVRELSAEGREFAPSPGVVLARALQIVIASTPALPEPDLTRPLTREEQERASRMAAALSGARARLVQATWLEFSRHARTCAPCDVVAMRCRQSGATSRQVDAWIDDVCRQGRPLYEAWREAVFELAGAAAVQQEAAL